MPTSSLELIWGIIVVTAVLLILAVSILVSIIIQSKRMKESENKFRLLFNRVFDALVVIDEKGKIFNVNESTCNLLGYSRNELLKLSLKDLAPEDTRSKLQLEFNKVIKGGFNYMGETKLINKNGNTIHVEVGCVNLNIDGNKLALGSFRDITEHKQAKDALNEKNIALKEILTHLQEEKMKLKQEIARNVDQVLMPALNKMINEDGSVNKVYYDLLKKSLQELAYSTGGILHTYSKLSPREVEVCSLIKNGATSKEIARTLNISLVTVNKHRERIRKKLVISNKNINLTSYLKKYSA